MQVLLVVASDTSSIGWISTMTITSIIQTGWTRFLPPCSKLQHMLVTGTQAVASTNVSAHTRGFCMTPPTSMYGTGLTLLPSSRENPCFVFFYPSFVVDSWRKYALAVVAAFLLGLLCEVLRWSRTCLRRRRPPLMKTSSTPLAVFTCCEALLFMAHVTTTYAVMLLVMSMEGMMVVGCITGLAVGYCATETMLVLVMRQRALGYGSEAEQLRIESSETLSLSDACCSISSVEEGGAKEDAS